MVIPSPMTPASAGVPAVGARRFAGRVATLAALTAVLAACDSGTTAPELGSARLDVRHAAPTGSTQPGSQTIVLGNGRNGLLHIPASYDAGVPTALAVLLHGAGGEGSDWSPFIELAETHGFAFFAPSSTAASWDLISLDSYGPDIAMLEANLPEIFAMVNVDPERLALGGFSDGGSYALSVGQANGDLFSHVIAFSPGFMTTVERVGKPLFFVSHGIQDPFLPIDQASRAIVPALTSAGYEVLYREFTGSHVVPLDVATEAFQWLVGTPDG